jgi:serine/threonine protein kinase
MTITNLKYSPPTPGADRRPISRLPSAIEPESDRHLIASRYRTQTRIGHGRLGEIFAAIDESYEELGVEQHLAIQVIPESIVGNNKLFNKINMGYTVLKAGGHPNIVNFLHFGRDANFGYLAMELLGGTSLRLVLDGAETLPLDEAKPVIRGVGEALRFLHAKDMVHGNLTTGNVFITDELEVRLLDVVPLDSSDAIFRGTAMNEPFSHCTVEDDVFGLACLAYEMLSGKHPFNYSPAGEARLAGLEADRIDSLTNSEWNALRVALSFDREERTSSVADFMRDFDITGTERLRPTEDQSAGYDAIACSAVEEAAPITRVAVPAQNTVTAASVENIEMVSLNENWPPNASPNHKGARPLRAVFLGMLLAGLGAWSYYGQPQEHAVNLIGYIDKTMDIGLTVHADEVFDDPATNPAQSVTTERVAQRVDPTAAAPAAIVAATQANVETKQPKTEREETLEESIADPEQPTDQPALSALTNGENNTVSSDEVTNSKADEVSAYTDADPMQANSALVVIESVVSVSERDGAALIVPPGTESSATPLIWWTSAHTAIADEDFIPVTHQIMAAASNDESNMLHIALINDNLSEPRESFFVNLGQRKTQQGQIDLIATVRVDIIDDDLP